jgi:hypothetical protein
MGAWVVICRCVACPSSNGLFLRGHCGRVGVQLLLSTLALTQQIQLRAVHDHFHSIPLNAGCCSEPHPGGDCVQISNHTHCALARCRPEPQPGGDYVQNTHHTNCSHGLTLTVAPSIHNKPVSIRHRCSHRGCVRVCMRATERVDVCWRVRDSVSHECSEFTSHESSSESLIKGNCGNDA